MSEAPATTRIDARIEPEQEIRLAVVLYGGVSLAIYMYGIAEEFLHLVRATAPKVAGPAGPAPGELAFPEPESTEIVYRKLGRLLPLANGGDGADADGPVRTRFVVDIISGTSAGGINGVCLAKALANGTTLAGLKRLWLSEGDIGVLVNDTMSILDAETRAAIPGLRYEPPPRSLLNSDRMLMRLVRALGEMDAPAGMPRPPLVDELDLWVTATDLEGLPLPLQFWNARADERRFANRYHFRYAPQDDADDFDADANGFLAFASRCTSSFPFAFPPMTLEHLARFKEHVPHSDWSRFYRDYARAEPDFPQRSFSDGGVLDNKPFSYATGSLVGRHALLPVDRKLIFVEPDPAIAGDGAAAARDWHALAVTQAAVLGIPRVEAIRSDIQSVIVRNRAIERVRDIVRLVGGERDERAKVRAVAEELPSTAWGAKWLSETIRDGDWGPSYGIYHRLKVRGVVDYLAELVVRAAGLDPDSDDLIAAHYLVRAWKESRHSEEPDGAKEPENQLLLRFSQPYRWRRVAFVIQKVKHLRSREAAVVQDVFTGCGLEPREIDRSELASVVEALMPKLSRAQEVLYEADRELAAQDGPLALALATLGVGRDELKEILDRRSDAEMKATAEALLGHVNADAFAAATKVVESVLHLAAAEATRLITEALGEHVSTRTPPDRAAPLADAVTYALRFYYDAFEAYDLLLFPLEYGTQLGETNPVEIIRISPRDANRRSEVPKEARALRGASIGHFGAFFELEWRKHDMLWGRLHAAECLIGALVPPEQAGPLIDEAQEIIAREFFDAEHPELAGTGLERLRGYNPPTCPEKPATLTVLDRAAAVTGEVVDGIFGDDGGGAARRVATAWSALRAAMRPTPGGWRAIVKVFRVLFRSRAFKLLVLAWAALVATGIALIAAGPSTRAAGAVLAGIFLLFGAVAVGAVCLAVAKVRKAIESRVGRFVFGSGESR